MTTDDSHGNMPGSDEPEPDVTPPVVDLAAKRAANLDSATGTPASPVPVPVSGAILSAEENAELDARLPSRGALVLYGALKPARAVKSAAVAVKSHEPTMNIVRPVIRHTCAVIQGVESWAKRAWDASTMGVYRRAITTAEATGNQADLKEWTDRQETAKERRHQRLMDLPRLFLGVVKVAGGALVGVPALVLLISILSAITEAGSFTGVWSGFFATIGFVIQAVSLIWGLFLMALPVGLVVAAWREGMRRATPPAWLVTTDDTDVDVTIDETTIAQALKALRIPAITDYLKRGLLLQFITPARVDGRGTHAVVRLPDGVTAAKIARRRPELATGLRRAAKEVWLTTGTEAGILDMWIADKGALADGAGPYPLLKDGVVDFFKGVPAGRTLRGDPILAPMAERNTITGGMPGQGKSTSARVMMIGVALDPIAELRIWVPDTNYDFEGFKRRCSRYVMGDDDASIKQIHDDIKALYEEVQRRGQLLVDHEITSVTRDIAHKGVGLHPLVCLLEEAHLALYHETYGKEIQKYVIEIVRTGRKRGIHMIVSTQAPTAKSMPRDVTRNCSNGIAFAVGDNVANDALLGQGAYTAGHRATELIPGTDRGTSIVKGFNGERSEILQWYNLDASKENDQVTPLINRALAAITKRNQPMPGAAAVRIESRDLLADLDEVLGADPVPIANVPALLKRLAPTWIAYQSLTGKALREVLEADYGIKVPATGNRYPLDPATVRDALARRKAGDGEENDTGQLAS